MSFSDQRKIMIVDDEPDIVELVRARLSARGYSVVTACGGREALEKAESEKPDLILLDITMPGMDGWRVLRRLRDSEATGGIPVVMLTSHAQTSSIVESQKLQAVDYFIKPFDDRELVAYIERYVR